jgi:membrane-bound serine protease (ClpP class)
MKLLLFLFTFVELILSKYIVMKKNILLIIGIILFQFQAFCSQDSTLKVVKTKKVYTFKIHDDIAPPAERKTKKAMKDAESENADLIILHLNTFGGMLNSADVIRTTLLESKIPVWVFIDNNAASAGALISIACDSIYMRPGANIGAASVVNQTGEVMPDKYQSYMRSMMRSTAQAKGRDPKIAEAMVDPRIYIEGINDSNKVLTFTTEEAMTHGYCEGSAESIDQILKDNNIENYTIVEQKLSWLDSLIGFLVHPAVSGILIMMIIGGIYFELQSPGVGFPLIIAILGATLYFAPLYLEGLAANWEILIFILGLALLAVEIFVIPGFGVAGISGIFLIVMSLTLSLVHNQGFDFSFSGTTPVIKAFFVVIIAMGASFFVSIWLSKKMLTTTRFGELALSTTQQASDGFTSADLSLKMLIGQTAVAITMLRPAGKIEINNEIYDATAESGYIDKGESVVIVKYENQQMMVRKN